MDNLTWLKERKKGIGGSDVAAVLGLSKYKTALDVYLDKTTDEITVKESEALRQGKDLEPYVASRFTEETGLKVYQKNEILQHPEYPYIIANIDYFIEGMPAFLECKTTANKYNFNTGTFSSPGYLELIKMANYIYIVSDTNNDSIDSIIKAATDLNKTIVKYKVQKCLKKHKQ